MDTFSTPTGTIKIELTPPQLKLLAYVLRQNADDRDNDGCNDMDPDEVKAMKLTKDEWREVLPEISESTRMDAQDEQLEKPMDMSNLDPILFVLNTIMSQMPKEFKKLFGTDVEA